MNNSVLTHKKIYKLNFKCYIEKESFKKEFLKKYSWTAKILFSWKDDKFSILLKKFDSVKEHLTF